RRHTSSDRDWSSDVCSSDLVRHLPAEKRGELETTVGSLLLILARDEAVRARGLPPGPEREGRVQVAVTLNEHAWRNGADQLPRRSEERRVGKGGRSSAERR